MTPIVFVDTETTGLVAGKDRLLEIAVVVLHPETLELLEQAEYLMPVDPVAAWKQSGQFVRDMHTKNGLWTALDNQWSEDEPITELQRAANVDQAQDHIDACLAGMLARHGIGPNAKVAIAGYNPGFDLGFLQVELPRLAECFNHYKLDVRSVQQFLGLCGCAKYQSPDHPHRALGDALDEVEALRYYREQVGNLG